MTTALLEQDTGLSISDVPVSIFEAIQPFEPDDNQKGTYLTLRISGADKRTALKLIDRKYRSWQNWRATDEDFYRLDEQIPILQRHFGSEAKTMRTTLLDVNIVEAGIMIFRKIISNKRVTSDMWAYATKIAGLRIPTMGVREDTGNSWEQLASSIRNTMAQREMTVKEIGVDGIETSVTAKEVLVQQGQNPKQMADEIINQMLDRTNE